jgi:hypothetical protein
MGALPVAALGTAAALGLETLTIARVLGCLIVAGAIIAGMRLRPAITHRP